MGILVIVHPVIAVITVVLCLANVYLGMSRKLLVRGSRARFIKFDRDLHIKIGKSFILLLFIAFTFGLIGIRDAGAPPFSTPHSYLGVLLLGVFGAGAVLAFRVLDGKTQYITLHGRLMILGAIFLLLQVIGGIINLRAFEII